MVLGKQLAIHISVAKNCSHESFGVVLNQQALKLLPLDSTRLSEEVHLLQNMKIFENRGAGTGSVNGLVGARSPPWLGGSGGMPPWNF